MSESLTKQQAEEKFTAMIRANRKKYDDLKQHLEEYESLTEVLENLPNKISHKIMVPFSNVAFMDGELDRTNELQVLIGDNYFVKCSAKHALGILERRKKFTTNNIDTINKEFENVKSKLGLSNELLDVRKTDDGFYEIIEKLDEEEEEDFDVKIPSHGPTFTERPTIEVISSTEETQNVDTEVNDIISKFKNQKITSSDRDSLVVDMGLTFDNKTEEVCNLMIAKRTTDNIPAKAA